MDPNPTSVDLGRGTRELSRGTKFTGLASMDPRPMLVLVLGSRGFRLDIPVLVSGSLTTNTQVNSA